MTSDTPRSCEMVFHEQLYQLYLYLYLCVADTVAKLTLHRLSLDSTDDVLYKDPSKNSQSDSYWQWRVNGGGGNLSYPRR